MDKQTNMIQGNWSNCSEDGYYIEIFFEDNLYRSSDNDGYVSEWLKFEISGDTLIQYDPYTVEDTVVVSKAIINTLNKDSLSLSYLPNDNEWILIRIIDKDIDINEDSKLVNGTRLRSYDADCLTTHKDLN